MCTNMSISGERIGDMLAKVLECFLLKHLRTGAVAADRHKKVLAVAFCIVPSICDSKLGVYS